MDVRILGTGNAVATECYNTCFLMEDETRTIQDRYFLVDGGGGNQLLKRLKDAGTGWESVRTMFLTHRHMDHLTGMIWMMRMILVGMQRGEYEGEAVIYGHDEVIRLLRKLAALLLTPKDCAFLDERLHLVEVENGQTWEILGRKTTFFDVGSTKAKQFGFSMEYEPKKKLVCCGDEPCRGDGRRHAEGADWLFHEALCLERQADIFHPQQKHHSTAADAAKCAEELGVSNLLLYHTEDMNLQERRKLYTEEARKYYRGNVLVPDDMEVIRL